MLSCSAVETRREFCESLEFVCDSGNRFLIGVPVEEVQSYAKTRVAALRDLAFARFGFFEGGAGIDFLESC